MEARAKGEKEPVYRTFGNDYNDDKENDDKKWWW